MEKAGYNKNVRRKGMGNCKDFMVIHLAPSCPLREVKEEGVFVFLKTGKERRCKMMHGFFLSGLFVLSAYVAPDKEYGLKTPYTIGFLCKHSSAIIVGIVESTKGGYEEKWDRWLIVINLLVSEDIMGVWKDSLLTLKTTSGSLFSPAETVLVFVQDSEKWAELHPRCSRCPWLGGDTMEVACSEFGKYAIRKDTVRFEQFGIKKFGIPLEIAKGIIKSAIEYPDIVDAKIDTIYEEAKEMLKTKDENTVRQWVYGELRKIGELVKE